MFEVRNILVRMRQGDSDRSLARAGLIGRDKSREIRRIAVAHGWLDSSVPLPENEVLSATFGTRTDPLSAGQSSVEPYRDQVQSWVSQGIQSTTIYQALVRHHQFVGSYSSVYRFVRGLSAGKPPKATVQLEFAPGEAAQVDFGTGPKLIDTRTGEQIKSWFFLMTLAFSRHQYAELVLNQKVTTWLECHRRALEFFGGVVERIIIDNAKCAITKACYYDPVVQRAYAEYAEGYGFKIDALPPREPQMKGRVESGIKYLKRGFMPIRQFTDLHDANRQLHQWIFNEAGNRRHGTTGEKPLTLFVDEKPLLKPLPIVPPESVVWAKVKVHRDAHVQFDKCLYSVPYRLIGHTLWLKAAAYMVRIYQEHRLLAVHPRVFIPGSRRTLDDHLPPNALAYKMRNPIWCREQAQRIGMACHTLVCQLFDDRVLHNLRTVQGILALEKTYGAKRLEAACQRALDFHNPRYHTVKSILKKGLDSQPNSQQAFDTLADCYTGRGRYCRDTSTMLKH
ncbi:IS21 family transposase [Pseudomonadota bacterium]